MQDLPHQVLAILAETGDGWVTSPQLVARIGCVPQQVVGAVKSLEVLDGYIETEVVPVKKWTVSSEGEAVRQGGSHEAIVWDQLGTGGLPQKELMEKCGQMGKVGFSKAMSNGWIVIDKTDGGKVKRKVDSIDDFVRTNLNLLAAEKDVDEKIKTELKKRKLVEEVTEKIYRIKKGENFQTKIEKIPSEITPEMIQSGSWKNSKFKPYNLNALGVDTNSGHLHPLLKVRAEYRQIFLEMGFTEMPTNNYMESSFWNFDALFQPQQHPARDAHDTFFISDPALSHHFPGDYLRRVKEVHSSGGFGSQGYGYDWKIEEAQKNLLRTHTTAVSARMLYKLAQDKQFVPQKYFSIDRVFRNETLDATHLAEFHQIEGVVADRGLTLGDLIGVLYQFFQKLGIDKLRFKPAYNPYTEPSMEIFAYHPGLAKWVEIGNSGMFRPEMLLPMGLPEDVNVIAWGLSLERPTMIKYGIDNIRDLVGHKVDLGMVQTNPFCRLDKPNTAEERRMAALTTRWDRISSRLAVLQKRVEVMGGGGGSPVCGVTAGKAGSGSGELVVHCPASTPPHSLAIVLPTLTRMLGSVHTTTHLHSSLEKSPGKHILPPCKVERGQAKLKITLIYTNTPQSKLMVGRTGIVGEANILRYLARIVPGLASHYETSPDVAAIDSVLDCLAVQDSKHQVTKALTPLLESGKFVAGSNPSIADLLAASLVISHKIDTPAVQAWRGRLKTCGFLV